MVTSDGESAVTAMHALRQQLLFDGVAGGAFLTGILRVYLDYLSTSVSSFVVKHSEEGRPPYIVSMRLKSGNLAEFNRILEKEVIPLLQRQKGFREEIVLTNPSGAEAVGISIWEQKENAESYNREKFPEVQQLLAKVLEGNPQVKTYEVSHSTVHKIAAHVTA